MSEIHQKIPNTGDYRAAVELTDQQFILEQRDPWYLVYNYENRAHRGSMQAINTLTNAGVIALSVEPRNIDNEIIDPLMPMTHAFKHGELLGLEVIKLLPLTGFSEQLVFAALKSHLLLLNENELHPHQIAEQIIGFGEQGLELLDTESNEIVERWSDNIETDETVKRMFKVGYGAITAMSHQIMMQQHQEHLELKMKQLGWTDSVNKYFESQFGNKEL